MTIQPYLHEEIFCNTFPDYASERLYTVRMLDRCKRDYSKLIKRDTRLQRWVENILGELKIRPHIGQKLFANFPGCRSIHFNGNSYRIIYTIPDKSNYEILILDIGHRNSSYTDLARIIGQGK